MFCWCPVVPDVRPAGTEEDRRVQANTQRRVWREDEDEGECLEFWKQPPASRATTRQLDYGLSSCSSSVRKKLRENNFSRFVLKINP